MALKTYQSTSIPLLRQVLANGQVVRLQVISGSMDPLLKVGDLIVVAPLSAADLPQQIGSIITFILAGELMTHRLIFCDDKTFQTASDRTGEVDPLQAYEALFGQVIARERNGEHLQLTVDKGLELSQRGYRQARRLIKFKSLFPAFLHRPLYLASRLISLIQATIY
jgi:hypothetical protein